MSEEMDDIDFADIADESPLGPQRCLFPRECLMPGPHYTCECHTLDDLIGPAEAKKVRRMDRLTQRERRKARQLRALVHHLCGSEPRRKA